MARRPAFFPNAFALLKQTAVEWLDDKAPQLGAALAYYTVFSLAPLVLVLLAIIGVLFRDDPAGAWSKITEQMGYFLDKSAVQVVTDIAQKASEPGKSTIATVIGIALALFGASGVFGQLQDALNTVWGVKAKPGLGIRGFLRARFLSFAMVFKFLPDVKVQWRDVWIGSIMTAILFVIGKWALGLYLGSGAASSAYG